MSLNIGMVARCLNTDHIRGMGKYVFELLRAAGDREDIRWTLFGDDVRYDMLKPHAQAEIDVFSFKGDRFRLWEQIGLPRRAAARHIDVLHCTEGTLPCWQPVPTVVTVHDTLAWQEMDDRFVTRAYFNGVLPRAMSRAGAVITISECSRRDILGRWPWLESKVHVIPHGISEDYFLEDWPSLGPALEAELCGSPYVVYLGGPMERKRFPWALEVLARWPASDLHLVACGFASSSVGDALRLIPHHLRGRVHFPGFLVESELRALYRGAEAVLYPTLYEGFGFPVVEAQASGTPVIFSALGSLSELVGPLALVVPSNDVHAWLGAISEAKSSHDAREERAKEAQNWARKFSWHHSLQQHLVVYGDAASIARR